jgi:hypothetical protein
MRLDVPLSHDISWRTSSFCASGECVEVTENDGMIGIRSSAAPQLVVWLTVNDWRSFTADVKRGAFNDLAD